MRFDLPTLYFLAIGTLLLSAAMTLWERQARPLRKHELGVLSAGYTVLAAGCVLALGRGQFSGALGAGLANMVMLSGYLLIYEGVAALAGRKRGAISAVVLLLQALIWGVIGGRWPEIVWSYVTALPIALASGLIAWELWRNDRLRQFRSCRIALVFAVMHLVFYAGRALALPLIVQKFGPQVLPASSVVTMYEGVLYSVGLPMSLLALLREEMHDQLLKDSHTDYLTGLGNRRWFFEEAEKHILQAPAGTATGMGTFLLAFDLDHFKTINDRYGHAMGDAVLKLFASFVRHMLGPNTMLARIGGEEFAALMACESGAEAAATAQRVVSGFAEIVADEAKGMGIEATVSIGLAELGCDGNDLASLLSAADAALYRAKGSGRNRIAPAEPFSEPFSDLPAAD